MKKMWLLVVCGLLLAASTGSPARAQENPRKDMELKLERALEQVKLRSATDQFSLDSLWVYIFSLYDSLANGKVPKVSLMQEQLSSIGFNFNHSFTDSTLIDYYGLSVGHSWPTLVFGMPGVTSAGMLVAGSSDGSTVIDPWVEHGMFISQVGSGELYANIGGDVAVAMKANAPPAIAARFYAGPLYNTQVLHSMMVSAFLGVYPDFIISGSGNEGWGFVARVNVHF